MAIIRDENGRFIVPEAQDTNKNGTAGRPTVFTPNVIQKLEQAFAMGCSIPEACFYANISKQTYYTWIDKMPELVDRFEELKENPTLKARAEVVSGIEGNPEFALKYLAKKKRDEFGDRLDITTDGKAISNTINLGVFTLEELKQFERLTQKATITDTTPEDTIGDLQKELL